MRYLACLLTVLAVAWCTVCYAQETRYSDNVANGIKSLQQKKYQDAERSFRSALEKRPDSHEATLLLGIVLNRQGSEGAESTLTRALYLDPTDQRTNLELGIYYYNAAVHVEAVDFFETTVAIAPDTEHADEARSYLKKIARKAVKRLSLLLNTGLEFDSNVALIHEQGFLPQNISRQSDVRLVIHLDAIYRLVDSGPFQSEMTYTVYQSLHSQLSRFNLLSQTVELSAAMKPLKGVRIVGGYFLDYDRVENATYSLAQGVVPMVSITPAKRFTTSAWYRYKYSDFKNSLRYPDNGTRSGNTSSVGIIQAISLGRSALLRLGFSYTSHVARALYQQYIGRKGYGVVDINLPKGYSASLYAGYFMKFYRGPDPLFLIPRIDHERTYSVGLEKKLSNTVNIGVSYAYIDNDSNIFDFAYDREISSVFVKARF